MYIAMIQLVERIYTSFTLPKVLFCALQKIFTL